MGRVHLFTSYAIPMRFNGGRQGLLYSRLPPIAAPDISLKAITGATAEYPSSQPAQCKACPARLYQS